MYRHASSPVPSHLCSLVLPLLAPPTTVTLKPFCLISMENFPALVGLSYGTAALVLFTIYSTAALFLVTIHSCTNRDLFSSFILLELCFLKLLQ